MIKDLHAFCYDVFPSYSEEIIDPVIIQETAGELTALLDEGHTRLVIAFTKVEIAVSSFLNALIKLKHKLDEKSGALRICNLCPPVRDAFTIPKLDRVFVIKATEKDALADF